MLCFIVVYVYDLQQHALYFKPEWLGQMLTRHKRHDKFIIDDINITSFF